MSSHPSLTLPAAAQSPPHIAGSTPAIATGLGDDSTPQAATSAGSEHRGAAHTDVLFWPRSNLRRLALEAGLFLAPYGPVSQAEWITLVRQLEPTGSLALADPEEQEECLALRAKLGAATAAAFVAAPKSSVHLGWRGEVDYAEYGDVVLDDSGLGIPTGWSAVLEPQLTLEWGRWWLAVAPRLGGRLDDPRRLPPPGLLYQEWNRATGRLAVGDARLAAGSWRVDWPRLVAGVGLGRWSLSAGLDRRWAGPGATGGLGLSMTGPTFPAVTVRRTAPFVWSGILRHVAPVHLLLGFGQLSPQTVVFSTESARESREDRPWFFQWLLTFRHTDWLRTTVVSQALAVPRSGSLWPDLLQINFPLLTATSTEEERGPVTDRIFTLQFEARFRNAPWPILPSAAGRIYWEYGGEDYLPLEGSEVLPRIAAPASVAGVELVSPRWDLAAEYVELEHPTVLWYAHGNFQQGYSHRGWILGHPLGGSGASLRVWLRWRPSGTRWEAELSAARGTWGQAGLTPARAERHSCALVLRRQGEAARWELAAEWNDEEVNAVADDTGSPERARWVRIWLRLTR